MARGPRVSASAVASPDPRPTAAAPRPVPAAPASFVVPLNTSVIKVLRRPIESALAALIGVHQHVGQGVFAAADRDGHLQGCLGEGGVLVLAHSAADDPTCANVEHAVEVELALLGCDHGAAAVPLVVEPVGAEVALDQVRCPP